MAATCALSAAKKEIPYKRGQGQKPGGPHAQRAAAKRSYPTSEVRGSGREEQAHARGQGGSWEDQPQVQGAVTPWAQKGLQEPSDVEGQEGRQ